MRILFFIFISCTPSSTKNSSPDIPPSSLLEINSLPSSPRTSISNQEGSTYIKNIGTSFTSNDTNSFLEKLFQTLGQNQNILEEVQLLKDLLNLLQIVSEKSFIGNFIPKGVDNLIPLLQQGLIAYYLLNLLENFPTLEIYSLTPLTNLASSFLKEGDFHLYEKILKTLASILNNNKENPSSTERNPNADLISMASSLNEKIVLWKNFFTTMGDVLKTFTTSTSLPPVFNAPTTQFAVLLANKSNGQLLLISQGTPLLNLAEEQRPIFFSSNTFLTIGHQLSSFPDTNFSPNSTGWLSRAVNRISSLFIGNNEDNGSTIISGRPTFNLVSFQNVAFDNKLILVNPNLSNSPSSSYELIPLEPISELLSRKNSSLKKK